ncbi:hypothetical protein L1887_59114 [Cichorium endivia]|nr:hypothetical protein L1887_59114 [Cichorium endivia]
MFSLTSRSKAKSLSVTGGARGIGLEVCRALAEAGASVALIYTSSKDAEQTAESIARATGQRVAKDFGKLDICVANAGIAAHHDSLSYAEDDWQEMMRVNLDGAMFTAQAAGNIFKKQGPGAGSMIFTASVSAILVNIPQKQSAYNASKAALVHLAKCLAVEWTEFARVNCISPGFIATDTCTHRNGGRNGSDDPGRQAMRPCGIERSRVISFQSALDRMLNYV